MSKVNFQQRVARQLKSIFKQPVPPVTLVNQPSIIALHNYKALYFPVPKVACSSLKTVCAILLDLKDSSGSLLKIHDIEFPTVTRDELSDYKNYWKFCFVRNPWDRLVSCWNEKIKADAHNGPYFTNGVHKGFLQYGNTFWANMSFADFARAVAQIPDAKAESHFRSQYLMVTDKNGNLLVDFIGRLENINQDFFVVCDHLGISSLELPHLLNSKNLKSQRRQEDYRAHYTDELKKLVKTRYAEDIEMFNYEF